MQLKDFIKANKFKFLVLSLVLIVVLLFAFGKSTKIFDPSLDKLNEDPRGGKDYALIYKYAKLYETIDSSDANLKRIQADLKVYARATYSEFKNPESLIGFTFDNGFKQQDKIYTFTGHYYSIKSSVQLVITKFDRGIIRLSITDKKTRINQDNLLSLNGPRNRLLVILPIEKNSYTIRYSVPEDKIVITFYQGYTKSDVDAAINILKKEYGNSFKAEDFTFNLNSFGIFNLDEVIANIGNPDPLGNPLGEDD